MSPRLRVTVFAALATLLGSLSLLPIYNTYGWLPRVVAIIATVAVTSAIAHRVRALVVIAPLLTVLAVAAMLTLMYAHEVAPLGFVPGPAALRRLHDIVSAGFTDTTQLSAPVGVTQGLSLMTTGGIGLVAVVVETLATGLRRPAVAGLPLLAIFTVPAAILNSGVGWRPFVFAAVGYLALLLAEGRDRIARWGRPVRAQRSTPARRPFGAPAQRPATGVASKRAAIVTSHLTQVGRRVGAAAIGVAVVVPVVIPGLHAGWFGTHHTSGVGLGSGDGEGGTTINPIVSMRRDLTSTTPRPLFTYTTTGPPEYLRMVTLDKFDGAAWTPAATSSDEDVDAGAGLPDPAGVSIQPKAKITTDVTVSGLKEPYLPVPMVPTDVRAAGSWIYNPITSVVYSRHNNTIRLSYEVTSDLYAPSAALLNAVVVDPADPAAKANLAVPDNLPASIRAQADAVIDDAHAVTPYQKALALQNWFQQNFTYSLGVKPGSGVTALVAFLRDRTGYCEQFAATMALMARIEGIPSRVDVGFTPGVELPGSKTYLVTTADAHSWPELYFGGVGWIRFEPTPRSDGQTTEPVYTTATAIPTAGSSLPANESVAPNGGGPLQPPGGLPHPVEQPVGGSTGGSGGTLGHLPVGWLVVLFVVVLAIAAAPALRVGTRRRRWARARGAAGRAHAGWAELGDELRDLRLEWHGGSDTPRRAAAALIATRRLHDPTARAALSRLAQAEELARYASPAALVGLADYDPHGDQRVVRRALFESVPLSRRLRARVLPSSAASLIASSLSDITDWVRGVSRRIGDATAAKLPAR